MSLLSQHIPFTRLVDLVDGRLSPDVQAAAYAHIEMCTRCAAEVAWLHHVIDLMRTDESPEPPANLVAQAVQLFRPRTRSSSPPLLQRIIAGLRFDSMQQPLAFGVRSVQSDEHRMLFEAEEYALDIRVVPNNALWSITGQVLGSMEAGRVVLDGPTGALQTQLNELCEFALPPVPAGDYTLTLQFSDVEVVIPELKLGL